MRKSYSVSEDDSSPEKVLSHPNSEQHSLLRAVRKMRSRRGSLQECAEVTRGMDSTLRGKFRGCLAGALVGDCIGTLFECDYSVSYSILGDLYMSLTNLSEDEILMDKHGIDFTLGPKKAKELLERKQRSSMISRPSNEEEKVDIFISAEPRHSLFEGRRGSFSRPMEKYSDDTVQTKSVAISLIQSCGLDQRNLAKQLTEDYFLNLTRKYGAFSREIFTQLRDSKYSDPVGPAKRSMSNIGSGGNEAASRVAPIALFTWYAEPSVVVDWATRLARITNYNKSGVVGAVCQALAVHLAFSWSFPVEETGQSSLSRFFRRNTPSPNPSPTTSRKVFKEECIPMQNRSPREFDSSEFCLRILEITEHLETRNTSILENFKHLVNPNREMLKQDSYSEKLRVIMEFLSRSDPPTRAEVVQKLGNGFKAIESVPSAIYSFLISMKSENVPEIPVKIKSPVLRTIFYAISLGGDSDSIAAMAGAIAGAFWGYSQIPPEILRVCEGSKELIRLADELYDTCKRVPMRP